MFSNLKMRALLSFATKWMDLDDLIILWNKLGCMTALISGSFNKDSDIHTKRIT